MAANGCAERGPYRLTAREEKECCPVPWITGPLCPEVEEEGLMRTLRIDRAGSTESVVISSGVDSCPSSAGSPSRPVTPQPMAPGPAPHCPYECLRGDSEDSGLGPSPAKSLASSPGGPVSPVPFGEDDRSDSLLDLSPRSDDSPSSSSFRRFCPQFLLTPEDDDFCREEDHLQPQDYRDHEDDPSTPEDDDFCREEEDHHLPPQDYRDHEDDPSTPEEDDDFCREEEDHHLPNQDYRDPSDLPMFGSHLNPTVVLIRSNFGVEEESRELTSDCTSSNCSQAGGSAEGGGARGSPQGGEDGACKWLHCTRSADANTTATDLVDHIRQCHVQSQPDDCKSYVCLWVGCKVFERPSCSRSWLERHVLLHGGSKPFRCIVDGCAQRFGSEAVLERHVNSHFPQSSRAGRLCRRRRHKHLRRPQSNKSKDFFDDATMEHVRHNLFQLSSVEGIVSGGPPSAITFHSTIVARRVDKSGRGNVLLRWTPEDILPDSWVAEDAILSNLERSIPLSKLPPQALQLSSMALLTKAGVLPRPAKRKRK